MQLVVTAKQMHGFDRAAIERYSLPGVVLMENAGRAFVDELEARRGSLAGRRVVIVCGKGNNGGDGFVIARHIANRGGHAVVGLLCTPGDLKGDAATNFAAVAAMAKTRNSRVELRAVHRGSFRTLGSAQVIVDAIFGTGFSGRAAGVYARAIEWINRQRSYIASVDIASGVDATTGIVEHLAVKANLTVTMGLGKIGQYVGDGREHSGEVVVADIGMPRFLLRPSARPTWRIEACDIKLPQRPLRAHKHSVGKILVVAGSRRFTGAPFMCAEAAMRAGAGAVILGVPQSIHGALVRKTAEIMIEPLQETAEGNLAEDAYKGLREIIAWADVVVVGPGIGRHPQTQSLVHRILRGTRGSVVLDADGLNAVASHRHVLRKRRHPTVITPHVGELSRLIELPSTDIERGRVEVARTSARMLNSILVLKGAPTATAILDGSVYLNTTGNPGMATAGSGDVLTGIIASLIGQGLTPEVAAYSGVFLHGLAGDLAAKRIGIRSVMAMDIIRQIPAAVRSLEL